MAWSKVKLRLCLLGFTLFLASVSVGLGAESESLSSQAGADNGCVNRCEGLRGKNNADEFAACVKGCGVNQRVSPRTEYEVCRLRCQMTGRGPEQQRCQQLCEEQLREREQREGRRDDDDENQRRDPEREREERRREEQRREQERRRREQEQREHERRGERDDENDENQRDPERRREQERREQERRRREQERRERERRGERDDEDDENQRDPERRREQERREQERRRREQERRERERRGERDDEDDENQRDPERRREQERREQERRRREQERRERERRGERDGEDDENQRDPERRREQERREQERRRREQERRERERRGERDDEDDENQRDPERRREQERREQERREQERRRREQERRERERRGERDDEDDENRRDPERRREQERREQERRRREQERRERERRGESDDGDDENQKDPDWSREQERRRREQERREREWEREHGRRGGRDENQRGRRGREEQRSREEEREREERQRERRRGGRGRVNQVEILQTEQEQSHNPYYFQEHRFQTRSRSDRGHWRVLERFSERSELLKGIKNQRLAILEARPQTFIIPHHLDAECVLLVVRGRATITTVVQEKRETRKESYNVECGDVMTVPAGTTIYLANHENEDLQIVKLIQPVNIPGEFKDYISAGGEAQAYYSVFSTDILEAALNIPRDRLERLFKQKGERRGKIVRASQEQLRALSQRATSVRRGSRGARAPIKLESQTPVYSNQYGQMFEACPEEFPQLRRTDVAAAVIDIKEGGMMVPHFNSRATWVVFVSEGGGSFEMACPHVHGSQWQRGAREEERHGRRGGEEEEERSGRIKRVAGRLSEGGVLVIPAGHPIAIMASPNENLRLVGFGINAENNQRNFLAGRENIMKEVDREAKELAFNVDGKQADEIFESQRESFFTEGPEGGRRRSTEKSSLLSVLKLAAPYF